MEVLPLCCNLRCGRPIFFGLRTWAATPGVIIMKLFLRFVGFLSVVGIILFLVGVVGVAGLIVALLERPAGLFAVAGLRAAR